MVQDVELNQQLQGLRKFLKKYSLTHLLTLKKTLTLQYMLLQR